MYGWMDAWMYGCKSGCIYGCIYGCKCGCIVLYCAVQYCIGIGIGIGMVWYGIVLYVLYGIVLSYRIVSYCSVYSIVSYRVVWRCVVLYCNSNCKCSCNCNCICIIYIYTYISSWTNKTVIWFCPKNGGNIWTNDDQPWNGMRYGILRQINKAKAHSSLHAWNLEVPGKCDRCNLSISTMLAQPCKNHEFPY